uniref:DUF202 domain-containing protein n=1 Tax=Caenorhabditis tropicalis TaxID=1561998 RepID=A0A1I7UMD4_9PELO
MALSKYVSKRGKLMKKCKNRGDVRKEKKRKEEMWLLVVSTGSLAFSVTMFLIGSVVCVALLQYRRFNRKINGELGGPTSWRLISAAIFVAVWLLYILLSTLEAYCVIKGF